MAATLANRGVNPITGRTALRGEYVESVLSVMETCGMYDSAGDWVYRVGMPAKSGVSGGILAVLPGQLGIGVFSPLLDLHGNSARGIRVFQDLSRYLDLHLLNRPAIGRLTLRRQLTAAAFNSTRLRTESERQALAAHGHRIRLLQLQGHLAFSTAEIVVREVMGSAGEACHFILDFKRVLAINESACHLIHQLLLQLSARGARAALTHAGHLPLLHRFLRRKGTTEGGLAESYPDNDRALEQAENHLLAEILPGRSAPLADEAAAPELLRNLEPAQRAAVEKRLAQRAFCRGEILVEPGTPAGEMYILRQGTVSVLLPLPDGSERRLATFTAGMTFGEMAMLDHAPRSARIVAETDGSLLALSLEDFEELGRLEPTVVVQLLRALCLGLSARLRKANAERLALD
jgi:glutaminase